MADKISQEEVLELMRNGWSCYHSHYLGRFSAGYWGLQKGKIGHGGTTKIPHGSVMNALVRKKLIIGKPYKAGTFLNEYVLPSQSDTEGKS